MKLITGITITLITLITGVTSVHAKIVFTNDVFWNEGEIFRVGQSDDAANTDLSLEFGSSNTETFSWDSTNTWFEVSDDFSLEGNQVKSIILDNQSGNPTSPSTGQIYHNTEDGNTYIYNGSAWEDITQGTGFTEVDSAALQARRTSSYTLTTNDQWYNIALDDGANDVKTDTGVINHSTPTDDITVYEDGTYRITYHITTNGSNGHKMESRIMINEGDAGEYPVKGSLLVGKQYGTDNVTNSASVVVSLSANDDITLQARRRDSITNGVINETNVTVIKLEGPDGSDGTVDPDVTGVTTNTFTMDTDDTGGNVTMQFGTTLAETLTWDNAGSEFDLSDDLSVGIDINQNGTIFTLDADNAGSGANVDIVSEQGSDNNGTLRYNATTNQWEISNDGGAFTAIATSGGTLDQAYDFGGAGLGRTIDADSGPPEITVSDTDNNAALILNQNDTINNPNSLEINNAGTGYSILADSGDGVFDEDVVIGGQTTRTPAVTGFSMNGNDLFVAGELGVEGNIYADGTFNFTDNLLVDSNYIRTTGDTLLQSNGDTDDYIYFDITGNEEYLYFEDASLAYANDPGFRLNSSTGEMEYRDEDESAWTSFDSYSNAETLDQAYDVGHAITVDTGTIDLNGTGELLELGNATGVDSYITFSDGTDRYLGWDNSDSALSVFDQQMRFRVVQSATPPVTCGSSPTDYTGMQWMDTDTGILYVCDTSNSRDKWLSLDDLVLWGEQTDSCGNGSTPGSSNTCSVEIGDGLGSDSEGDMTEMGYFLPHPITITGYGFSEDDDNCASSLDIEIWSTGSTADEAYTKEADIATGLTSEAHNSNTLNQDIAGSQYIIPGIENNCGGAIDDFNIILYYRYRHD